MFHFPEKHDQFCIAYNYSVEQFNGKRRIFQLEEPDEFHFVVWEKQTISKSVKFSIMQSNEFLRNTNFEISDEYKTFRIIYFSLWSLNLKDNVNNYFNQFWNFDAMMLWARLLIYTYI